MQSPSSIASLVEAAIGTLLAQQGYEVVLVEHLPGPAVLRLYIDRRPSAGLALAPAAAAEAGASGQITLDDCAKVSRLVSDVLDGEGVMQGGVAAGRYPLEVSSPGLDRPLTRPDHFVRFVGQPVRLRCRGGVEGVLHRRVEGLLVAANDAGIEVTTEGVTRALAYDDVERAQLVPQF